MPLGIGYPGDQRGAGLAGRSLSRQGIPQPGVLQQDQGPDREALNQILQMLKGGQVGAEPFLQFLSLLASSTLPQLQQQSQPQQRQQGGGGTPSIRQLLR